MEGFVFWSWLLLAGLAGVLSTDCPDACRCFLNLDSEAEQTVTVDCRALDLLQIPSPLPNATSHLDVSNNLIQSVQSGDIWPGATGIRHLQLQNNEISSIAADAFSNLQQLETLIIFNNYLLEELPNSTFDGLENLQRLVAYNTGIKKLSPRLFESLVNIVELDFSFSQLQCITSGTFQDLPRLKILTLSSNFITLLESGSFANLPSLEYLSLNHNQITAVPAMIFSGLDNIQTITLSGNPIECDCGALYLYQFLTSAALSGPPCEGPQGVQGRDLLELELEEFCEFPVANIIPSDIVIIPEFSPLELSCVTSGTPPPQVTWSRDGMLLQADGTEVIITEDNLVITNSSVLNSGQYHCTATSSAGLVSSAVQVLVLSEEQRLTEAVVRADVLLECSSGVPAGVAVQWSFNDSTLTPVSSKYVVLRNGSLLVQDVWVEDMGEYTCQLGDVQLRNTLIVTAVPEIISINQGRCEQPLLLKIDSDMIVVLRCVAVGIPPPTVQWILGSAVLSSSQPVPGMNGSEVEVTFELFRPAETEEGDYSCVASNDIGVAMTTLTVDVRSPLEDGPIVQLDLFAGDTALLECPVTGLPLEPGYQLTWGRRFGMLPLDRINFTCDNQTLILRNTVAPDDIGQYFCQVREPSGRIFIFTISLVLFEPPVIERACPVPVVTGLVGGAVELLCLTAGNRVTRVWSVGGAILEEDERVSFVNDGERVIIAPLEEGDAGAYTCTTSDEVLEQTVSDSLTTQLIVHRVPQLTSVPGNSSVISGNSVQLPCAGGGSPAPSLTWWRERGGNLTQVLTDGQYFITSTALVLSKAYPVNEGFYYCNASSVAGTVLSEMVFLDVLEPPVFVAFRPASTFKAGDMVVSLECAGSGDPEPDVQWLRLPEAVAIPSPAFPNYVLNGSDLVIVEVGREDAGLYRCSLTNVAGQVSQDITVTVKAPPSPSVQPAEVLANVGCQLTLNCLDAGQPPLDLQWSFNEEPVSVLSERGVQAVVRPNGDLQLNNLQLQHSGNYSCTVFNTQGEATAVAMVTVEDPVFASGVFSAPPTIISSTPSTQFLTAGQTVQFVCLVEGFPLPEVTWLKDGEALANLRRYEVLGEILVIRDVRVTDMGEYLCVASNPLGEDSRQFNLSLTAPPYIISHPLPQEVPEGGGVTLTCSASGDPAPSITWLLDGGELVPGDRHHITTVPATVSMLTLSNASLLLDSGTYSCLAENVVGIAQHSVVVTVTAGLFAPEFVTPPANQLVERGGVITVPCEVDADPPANTTWRRGDQVLPDCSDELLNMSLACVSSDVLIITSLSEEHLGQYVCESSNQLGRAWAEISLALAPTATSLPVFMDPPLLPLFVLNGSRFLLDCVASGAPPPDVRWLLNMEPLNVTEVESFEQLDNDSLLVLEAGEGTVGFFTCVADNGVGSSKVTVLVEIVSELLLEDSDGGGGLDGPVIIAYPLGILTLFPGQSSTLDCTASGEPPPTITWTRNGVPIPLVSLPSLSVADNGSLVLSAVTGAEEGNYSCVASNSAGTSVAPFKLLIRDDIVSGEGAGVTISILSGTRVELHCNITGSHMSSVLWLHAGEVVHESEAVRVLGNGSLLLPTPHIQHAGHYMCLTPSTRGWTDFSLHLHVTPREEPPYFTVRPEDVHVVKKGFVLLACSAVSSTGEPTHVQWTQAHVNMSRTGPRHLVLQDNSLLLSNVRVQEAGEYSCVASNSYGQSVVSATVTVSRLKVDQFVFSEEGSTVVLTCPLEGPQERVWLGDDHTPLTTHNGEVWLHNVDHTHQGDYTCYRGKTGLNYFLIVQAAPQITTPPSVVTVLPGETATLHCVAVGRPHPLVQWSHGDVLLSERGVGHSVLVNGSLVLYAVEGGRDDGVYVCQAHNTAGLAELRIFLFIVT